MIAQIEAVWVALFASLPPAMVGLAAVIIAVQKLLKSRCECKEKQQRIEELEAIVALLRGPRV